MAMTGGTAKLVHSGKANYGKDGYIKLYVYYKSTQDEAANRSTVYCGMYVTTPSSTYGIGPWGDSRGSYVGTTSNTFDGDIPNFKGTRWIVENKSFTVDHDASGNATATIYWKWGVNSPWGGFENPSGSFTITLPQIARASTIHQTVSADLGSTAQVKWYPLSSSFYYKVRLSYGSWKHESSPIFPNTTKEYTYTTPTIPYELAEQIPSNLLGDDVSVELATYSDSGCTKQIGDTDTSSFFVYIPENDKTKPTMTMEIAPVNVEGKDWSHLYVQGISKVQATLTGDAQYDATIASYRMNVGGKNYTSASNVLESNVLEMDGEIAVTGYVTDSRGISNSDKKTITVVPYAKPSVKHLPGESDIVCVRCYSDGTPKDDGTHIRIKAMRSYSKLMLDGAQHNFCELQYRYGTEGNPYGGWMTLLAKKADTDQLDVTLTDITISTTAAWSVQIRAVDDVGNSSAIVTSKIPTDRVNLHLKDGGIGVGVGKYCSNNRFEVALESKFEADATFEKGVHFGGGISGRVLGLGSLNRILSGTTQGGSSYSEDVNDYTYPGVYGVYTNEDAAGIYNLPVKKAGTLRVYSATGDYNSSNARIYLIQEYVLYDATAVYRRTVQKEDNSTWSYSKWYCYAPNNL